MTEQRPNDNAGGRSANFGHISKTTPAALTRSSVNRITRPQRRRGSLGRPARRRPEASGRRVGPIRLSEEDAAQGEKDAANASTDA
jgi:hypothetical protein